MNSKVFIGEILGTFILCFFGIGGVATATLFSAHTGAFQTGMITGFSLAVSIYAVRNLSGAHLSPVVTLAFCIAGRLSWKRLPLYVVGQVIGAFLAARIIWMFFAPTVLSLSGSELVNAMTIWCEPYPNAQGAIIPPEIAALGEGIGAFILLLVIFANTDDANAGKPGDALWPLIVGLCLALIICTVGPMTDGAINPVRDIGPRLVAALVGFSNQAFSDPNVWIIYTVAPLVGGVVAALLWRFILAPQHRRGV